MTYADTLTTMRERYDATTPEEILLDVPGDTPVSEWTDDRCWAAEDVYGAQWLFYVEKVGEQYATLDGFDDAAIREYDSRGEWLEDEAEQVLEVHAIADDHLLACYFNAEAYCRDLELGGDVSTGERDGAFFVMCN